MLMKYRLKYNTILHYILLMALLTGCSLTKYPGRLKKLQTGMTVQEAVNIMGEPSAREIIKNNLVMVYHLYEDLYSHVFTSKFPFIGFYPLSRTGSEYWLIFNDGILVAAGKKQDLLTLLQGKYSIYLPNSKISTPEESSKLQDFAHQNRRDEEKEKEEEEEERNAGKTEDTQP